MPTTTSSSSAQVSRQLYTLSIFNFIVATLQLISPSLMLTSPPIPQLSVLTGYKMGTVNETIGIAMSLKMYIIALMMLHGARDGSRGIRTAALLGTTIYAFGAYTTLLLKPDIEGGVTMLFTGVLYSGFSMWMASTAEWGEVRQFVLGSEAGAKIKKQH